MEPALGLLLVVAGCGEAAQWSYQLRGQHGPAHWAGECGGGAQQSPIDIPASEAVKADLGPWSLHNYDSLEAAQLLSQAEVVNNGHTLKLSPGPMGHKLPAISGAGLKNKYNFAQLHLHWGNTSVAGSEHTVAGARFPLELHLVHYNARYADISEAVGHEDGLAVVGILFQLSREDNPSLGPLLDTVPKLTSAKKKTTLGRGLVLGSLLPASPDTFYRYEGSLTTPGCNEIVTWSVLRHAAAVSEQQLRALRSLLDGEGHTMGDNYRPVMPLNRRVVLLSGAGGSKHTHHHHQPVPAPKLAAAGSESGGGLLVPGWAVVLVSLCVALNVGAVVWLLARRGDRRGHHHLKIATAD